MKRVLIKISGEILRGTQASGVQMEACLSLAQSLAALAKGAQLEIAVVIGGGNICRGINFDPNTLDRAAADQMGMLATLMNGIALEQAFSTLSIPATVLSALECPRIAETYTWRRARTLLSEGRILILVGGTGNPFFTTDTAAALRASEVKADALLKATKVDGIYDKDPVKYPDAKKFTTLTYSQILAEKLEVMDATSVALCRSHHIPIYVFNMKLLGQQHFIELLLRGNPGTLVTESTT